MRPPILLISSLLLLLLICTAEDASNKDEQRQIISWLVTEPKSLYDFKIEVEIEQGEDFIVPISFDALNVRVTDRLEKNVKVQTIDSIYAKLRPQRPIKSTDSLVSNCLIIITSLVIVFFILCCLLNVLVVWHLCVHFMLYYKMGWFEGTDHCATIVRLIGLSSLSIAFMIVLILFGSFVPEEITGNNLSWCVCHYFNGVFMFIVDLYLLHQDYIIHRSTSVLNKFEESSDQDLPFKSLVGSFYDLFKRLV